MKMEEFAQDELKDYTIYRELAKMEKDRNLKLILQDLSKHELNHYNFFLSQSAKKDFHVNKMEIFWFKLLRRIFGLTFTLKFLERHERNSIENYEKISKNMKGNNKMKMEKIVRDEKFHEESMIKNIKEERVKYMGSIVLGFNDGLVELTGALAGFTAVLQNNLLVGASGLITGIAASLSMASSAYLQAKEEQKNPRKSAFYTGLSYISVVLSLIFPFFLFNNILFSLASTIIIAIVLVCFTAFYLSVLFERNFKREVVEMFAFSFGIAITVFVIGFIVKQLIGIQI